MIGPRLVHSCLKNIENVCYKESAWFSYYKGFMCCFFMIMRSFCTSSCLFMILRVFALQNYGCHVPLEDDPSPYLKLGSWFQICGRTSNASCEFLVLQNLRGYYAEMTSMEQQTPARFSFAVFLSSRFTGVISGTLPFFMVLAWVYSSAMIIKSIVVEKELRLKEVMKVKI